MSWKHLLAKGKVKTHQTSKQELDNIRALIARDLADASVAALSADRRFATAYNAALQAGTIVVACFGYRVSARAGHRAVTFEAAALISGAQATPFGGLRELTLERDGRCCRVCGASGRDTRSIIVHHRVPGRSALRTLVFLCPACRAKVHHTKVVCSEMPPLLLASRLSLAMNSQMSSRSRGASG